MNSLVTQIAMTVLAAGILFMYVRPTFINIGVLQDSVTLYQTEREKVIDVNNKLAELVKKVDAITPADRAAMLTYLPDVVDDVAVSRDILLIAETAEVYLRTVQYNKIAQYIGAIESEVTGVPKPTRHEFKLEVSGTYEQTKLFLSLLEQNNYPLEVHTLNLVTTEEGIMDSSISLFTYSHKEPI